VITSILSINTCGGGSGADGGVGGAAERATGAFPCEVADTIGGEAAGC
jgi:hypothetical protein